MDYIIHVSLKSSISFRFLCCFFKNKNEQLFLNEIIKSLRTTSGHRTARVCSAVTTASGSAGGGDDCCVCASAGGGRTAGRPLPRGTHLAECHGCSALQDTLLILSPHDHLAPPGPRATYPEPFHCGSTFRQLP